MSAAGRRPSGALRSRPRSVRRPETANPSLAGLPSLEPDLFFAALASPASSSGSGAPMNGRPSMLLPRPLALPQTQAKPAQRGQEPHPHLFPHARRCSGACSAAAACSSRR